MLSNAELQQLQQEIVAEVTCEIRKGVIESCPATSCKEILENNLHAPSGKYWVNSTTGNAVQVYCLMETTNCGNITGGWMRVAYMDVTNENNTCPQGLNVTVVSSTRMCTRSDTSVGCSSVTFPTFGVPYTKVCGRARGYQFYSADGFANFHNHSLSGAYIDGLSVTHGLSHIWTFAVGNSKAAESLYNCPCARYGNLHAPPPQFVGENYFCESGNSGRVQLQWYLDDPLWDSQGCASGSTCCNRGGPWFTTTLSQQASDNIEVKLCVDETDEDVAFDQLEIFVHY